MLGDLNPYPAYKDSGIAWLGDVPEHWEVRRIKQTFRKIVGGSTPSSTEADYWDGKVVWVTPADVSKTVRLRSSLRRISHDGLASCSAELVPPGSIVVTSRAPVGNVAIAETELCTNQGCKALIPDPKLVNSMFGFHIIATLKDELQSLAAGTTFLEISTRRIGAVAMPLPPLPEQAAIVRFLNYAEHQIRRYIRIKQKLIKLLDEQRQAIIRHAITRGLEPTVRHRPSGVEWLGDVPEHWEIKRCRFLFREVDERSADGSEPHLSMSQRVGLVPSHMVENRTLVSESYAGAKLCEVGDLVLNRLKAHLGVFALAQYSGVISPDYTVLRPFDSRGAEYFEQVLRSPACRQELRVRAKGIVEGFWRLYTDDFYDIRLPVPPADERLSIVEANRRDTMAITATVARTQREIAMLDELRNRLIAGVVTGKFDVREAAAALPDAPAEALEDVELEQEDVEVGDADETETEEVEE